MTKKEILDMSYTDFIGFVNQWNVLPGAYNTLSKWIVFSKIESNSKILELASTSGFSLREISLMTNSSGLGLDISEASIKSANYNKEQYAPDTNINYIVANGDTYENTTKFSHVIVGAALKFFPNPKNTINKIVSSYLMDGGYLLASPFYTIKEIPTILIEEAQRIFDIKVTTTNYKETMSLYRDFEIIYEDRENIMEESEEELEHYCKSTINRACQLRKIEDEIIKESMYQRLMEIKRMSNKLRQYQNYSVLVLRYRKNIYPNRYTELF